MKQKIIWITGASSGIGAETALQMAKSGWRVAATARSLDKLEALAEQAASYDGAIIPYAGDVTDLKAMSAIADAIEVEQGIIDIALLNAGTYFPDTDESFTADSFKKTFDVNVNGMANCVEPLLKKFRVRRAGHIAIVASVAGYRGLPRSLSYGATKAALINFAEALYIESKDAGIKVQVINPGFVKTPLTDTNDFEMPMLMPVEDAAKALIKGIHSNKFEITFPWQFALILKTIGLLPNKLYLNLIGKITAGKQ